MLFDLLEHYFWPIDREVYLGYWMLYQWPRKIKTSLEFARKNVQATEKVLMDGLKQGKQEIRQNIEQLNVKFSEIKTFAEFRKAQSYNYEGQQLNTLIQDCIYKVTRFNNREELLEIAISEYPELKTMQMEVKPYIRFWEQACNYQEQKHEWYVGPLLKMSFA